MRQRRAMMAMGAVVALAGLAGITTAPAWADSASVEVVSVAGQRVDLVMTLDPGTEVAPNAPVTGAIEIAGAVLPADTRLEVTGGSRPTTAILVLDASGSMSGPGIDAARAAATTFVRALPADVKVGVVAFNGQAGTLAGPTTDRVQVLDAIAGVPARGGTALFDGVRSGLDLAPAGEATRLVVLSDGKDTVSGTTLSQLTAQASAQHVPIDVVALRPTTDQLEVLRAISTGSGGALLTARTTADLLGAFTAATKAFGARIYLTADVPTTINPNGQPVTATAQVGTLTVHGTVTLPVADSSGTATTLTAAPPSLADWAVPILLGLAITTVLVLLVVTILRANRMRRERERVDQLMAYGSVRATDRTEPGVLGRHSAFAPLDQLMGRRSGYRKTQVALAAAEVRVTPAEWLVIRLGLLLVLSILFALLLRSAWLGLIIGVPVGWLVAFAWLRSRGSARQTAFAEALPDFIMLLASSMRAGMSFPHALESASARGTDEVSRQMQRVLREVQVGATLETALMECAERMDNDDLRWTVTAMSIQREVGGSLSAILDTAVATIKARQELGREVRTLSADGRISSYILLALPVGVAAFLLLFRREYVSLLWSTTLGIVMLVAVGVLMLTGWLWMRAIVRIRV